MKKLWKILTDHIKEDFNPAYYFSVLIILAGALSLNYAINLENGIIDRNFDQPIRVPGYFLLYGVVYFSGVVLVWIFKKQNAFRSGKFLILSLSGLAILSIDSGFPFVLKFLYSFKTDSAMIHWAYLVIKNGISLLIIPLPLLLIYYLTTGENKVRLGLNSRTFDARPYFTILLIILPFIFLASLEHGLGTYYPTYKKNSAATIMEWPEWLPLLMYEAVYGSDFLTVELLFRGFFVIGMTGVLGKNAIIPMAMMYCSLHFGKPVVEAISSVFGGYILGVLAYYTRSIWGGVIVHVGLAWMMELAAFFQSDI